MIRQGKYTKRLTLLQKTKRYARRRWTWFKGLSKPKKAIVIGGPLLAFLILTPLVTYAYFARDIADKERLMNRNNTGIVLMDKNGETFYRTGRAEHREEVSLDAIADTTEDALVASEDKGFYEHPGFSVGSMLGALYANFTSGAPAYGGSTLTQQLAKNTLLSDDRNYLRKYQELSISIAIERTYSKDEILSMYLNSVYYGEGAFGIEDAAKTYFNKSPADLSLAESAMLIGILPAPANYSPISGDPELAKERQATVLTRMVNNKFITEHDKVAALAEQLVYNDAESPETSNVAPHFTEMVLNELYEKYGEERVTRSGYQVKTTLDLGLQKKKTENIASNKVHIQAMGGSIPCVID
jgi:membrane peptidoglycan carboxypeptidase